MKKIMFIVLTILLMFGCAKDIDDNSTLLFSNKEPQSISIDEAKIVAMNWYTERWEKNKSIDNIEIIELDELIYVFNFNSDGFIMISSSCATVPVLGYCFNNKFNLNDDFPPQFNAMIKCFKDQIIYANKNKLIQTDKIKDEWNRLLSTDFKENTSLTNINPLLNTNWDQDWPWNQYCPSDNSGPGNHVYAGCVAVSQAQVMKYWEYPNYGIGSHGYNSDYGWLEIDFSEQTYNWDEMLWSSSTTETAKLLYHIGVSIDMEYSPYGSGAYVFYGPVSSLTSFKNYFGYCEEAVGYEKNNFSDSDWAAMIREELNEGRPLDYRGYGWYGGHAFNLDGYQGTNYFHFNWGWSGAYNGYYYLTNLNPGGSTFTNDQGGIFNLYPSLQSEISVIYPNGGEEFEPGITETIVWNSQDLGNYVKIELYSGNNYYATIANIIINSGVYNWTISGDCEEGHEYRIKIIDVNNQDIFDFSDGYFSILSSIVYGDVDGNNEIQAYDAALVLQYSASIIEFEEWQFIASDVDMNGEVQAYDAALILQYSAGIIDEFPVEGGRVNSKRIEEIVKEIKKIDVKNLSTDDITKQLDRLIVKYKKK